MSTHASFGGKIDEIMNLIPSPKDYGDYRSIIDILLIV